METGTTHDVLQRLVTAQAGNNVGNALGSKVGQFALLTQGDIYRVVVKDILADDTYHRLHFLRLGYASEPVPELFNSFLKYHISVFSFQLSVFSCQLTVDCWQLTVGSFQLAVVLSFCG